MLHILVIRQARMFDLLLQVAGVFNGGYWGINVAPRGSYRLSLYLKYTSEEAGQVIT